MTLSFEISDDELNEIVSKGVKNLSEETITDIAKQAISEYLSDRDVIAHLIFSSYSGYMQYDSPKKWFLDMLANSFSDDEIKEYRAKILKTLDDEKREIVIDVLSKIFSEKLVNDEMKYTMARILASRG